MSLKPMHSSKKILFVRRYNNHIDMLVTYVLQLLQVGGWAASKQSLQAPPFFCCRHCSACLARQFLFFPTPLESLAGYYHDGDWL